MTTCQTPPRSTPHDVTTAPAPQPPPTPARPAWITALALAAGTAVLVGAEFVPAGVLPSMAADLAVTEGRAGLAVAATALAGAVTAPNIAAMIPRADRRLVLMALLFLAIISNAMVALAGSFAVVLLGRVVLGVAIAGYWTFTFSVGVHLTGRPALVSTSLAAGTGIATIIGVPLASLLGDQIGWRAVFWVIVALTAAVTALLAALLPAVPAQPGAGWPMMRRALANPRLMLGVLAVALAAMGNFTAYPYIRLAIEAVAPGAVAALLLLWGLGGLLGTLVGGYLSRWLRVAAALAPAVLMTGLLLTGAAHTLLLLTAAVLVWGLGFNMVPVITQLWVAAIEPQRVESAVALQVTAFQLAITAGAVLGGMLVDQCGTEAAIGAGAVVALAAALVFAALPARPRES